METTESVKRVLGAHDALHTRRRWLIVAVIATLLSTSGWYWVSQRLQSNAPTYLTTPVRRGDLVVTVTATGTVQPTDVVEISSELSGTVRTVNVGFNDHVTVGQVLANLDTDRLEDALAHSRATLEARRAQVAESEVTVAETRTQDHRVRELFDRGIATLQALQKAEADYARAKAAANVARANAKVAEADLSIEETNLAKACICSPIDGVVLTQNVEVGTTIATSLQTPVLFTIARDLAKMEVQVDIDEADVSHVRVGQAAVFSVEAYQQRSFAAVIAELRFAPQTVDGVVTYKAVLSVDNSNHLLRPGLTATAEITVNEFKDALLLPSAALRFAPPAEPADGESSGGGLLGLIIPDESERTVATVPAGADGSQTVWILKQTIATPLKVTPIGTNGIDTAVASGNLALGDLVITDLEGG